MSAGDRTVRALGVEDGAAWDAARRLLDALAADAPVDLARHHLDVAARGESDEALGVGAFADGRLCGVVLFGMVHGAIATGRCMFIGVAAGERRRGMGSALVEAALRELRARGARIAFLELSEAMREAGALLERLGFVEVARVGGYFAEGVDLRLLQRAL